ncbi:MAG TPA: TonB family protein [Candidatus Baltobacteraceae bacterium]|nr:TonB family protein [Candidatus Baltobacteraceae bacterium]
MSYAIQTDDAPFKRFLGYSAWLHIGLIAAVALSVWIQRSGNPWGGIGGGDSGVKVDLVSSAGIPMPHPVVPTPSQVVDPTKGLAEEAPKIEEPKTDATKLPKFEKEKPLPPSKKSKVFEPKKPPPDNAINYGKGGGMDVPTGYSQNPGASSSGVAVQGEGGGDFATRYGWYVESVKRAISQNWIQTSIDPSVRAARRAKATATFRINRDGSIKNIRLDTSSGNRSMDDSATRALLSIDKFPTLPSDYSGSYVDVTFDFDLSSTH